MTPRRTAAVREDLITSAQRLISTRGTAGLTVRDIAREAGVAAGALYNHFSDKEELLALALHAHVSAVDRSHGSPTLDGTLAENLKALVTHALAVHIVMLPAFVGLVGSPEVMARFDALPNPLVAGLGLRAAVVGYLERERARGEVAVGVDLEIVATLLIGACHELVMPHLYRNAPLPESVDPSFVDRLVSTVLDGIVPR
ncbi:TetR/AcrR family transcriptional regulator [Saccharothrix violaceirubra]|uniref:AcrR family transcriptional regulator n=1 Tax=Saccharothrix violaceirubra TaxID=413306 RepID=A0A7W7T5I6_9PSEU|nr:TetR/AcrR family transcriptional regulator [Saccharothrix violaceirubra]MBB4965670.1 AcrR family transcriptional regulator [Saccharothrix violaceirubra]